MSGETCCSHYWQGFCNYSERECGIAYPNNLDMEDCPYFGGDQYLDCEVGKCNSVNCSDNCSVCRTCDNFTGCYGDAE